MRHSQHPGHAWGIRLLSAACALSVGTAATAQAPAAATPPTYADVASLAEKAAIVAIVEVRKQAVVEPQRAPGLAAGHTRLYIEARTEALLAARSAIGESITYLVDVPLDAKGKPPKLRKQRFLAFALPVPGRAGSLQLVEPDATLTATPDSEQLTRKVIAALAAPDVPPPVTGVREAMSVPGNLAGESETQVFLATASGAPVSLSVIRRPGMEPVWGVSWSEIVDQSARAPAAETAEWYRLACYLPPQLPAEAHLQQDAAARRQAQEDYAYILRQLGECARTRA